MASAKLDEPRVALIKQFLIEGKRQIDIAQMFGVSRSAIALIATNRTWTHVSVPGWKRWQNRRKEATS